MIRKFKLLTLTASIITLTACGGGSSDSGIGESLAQEREALDCVSFTAGVFSNSCDYPIIVRVFAGSQTPIPIPANSSAPLSDPAATGLINYGACKAPFTPVKRDSGFECL